MFDNIFVLINMHSFSKKGKVCFSILLKVFFFFRDLLKFYTLSYERVIQVQINISLKHRISVMLQVGI